MIVIFKPHPRIEKFLFYVCALLFILFAGFKEDSLDYEVYIDLFRTYKYTTVEPAFKLISYLVQTYTDGDIRYMVIAFAALGVSLKFRSILILGTSLFASVCIYLSNFYLLHEMTQIRAGVASALFLLSIKPLYDRNLKKFLLLALLAFTFHYSALIIFPLWFLKSKINKKLLFSSVFIGYALYFLGVDLIAVIPIPGVQDKIQIYLKLEELEDTKINVFNYVYLCRILILYVFLFNFEKLSKYSKYLPLLLNIYSLSLFSYTIFAAVPAFASRVSEFLGVVEIILFPMLAYLFRPLILGRAMIVVLALAFLLLNLYYVELILDI